MKASGPKRPSVQALALCSAEIGLYSDINLEAIHGPLRFFGGLASNRSAHQ